MSFRHSACLASLLLFVLGLMGFAAATAGAAPKPVMVSPPGIEDPYAFEESVDENYVYFNDATGLLRVTNAGAVERITPGRAIYLADSAQGVVVRSWESLDPADQGGNDLYLIRPNGESVLLTDGSGTEDIVNLPWSEFVGLTPDRRGILIWAPKGPPDNDLRFGCTIQGSGRCDLLAWRDGTFTVLDYGVPFFDYNGNFYRRWTGYSAAASNDLSTVMAGGEMVNENDISDGDPAAAKIFPTGKSDDVLLEQHAVVQASLDGERAIVRNVTYGDEYVPPSLYEWNGASLQPISPVGKAADFLGASPDLKRVWYLMEAGQAGYSLHFSENGKDRVVAPDVGTGILPDGYVDDDYAKVSDDGKSIGFVSGKRLTADDKETRLDAYVATGDGVRLASPGTKQDVEGMAFANGKLAFKSGERITCDDVDEAEDIYVDDGGRPALATAGSDDSSDADLVRLRQSGEVVFFTYERLDKRADPELGAVYRARVTGAPDCRLARKDVKVSFKGKARVARRSRRPKRGFFKVSSPTPATFRIQSVKGKSKMKLLKRRIGAGKSRVQMPYLSAKKFRPGKKYKFLVTLTGKAGGSFKRGFRIKVSR